MGTLFFLGGGGGADVYWIAKYVGVFRINEYHEATAAFRQGPWRTVLAFLTGHKHGTASTSAALSAAGKFR